MHDAEPAHILCIDDEEDILAVTALCLETIGGYRVSKRSNGIDGIAAASEHPPDLVLLDVMMPAMDGPAVLTLLRQHTRLKNIPIIFMTARVQPEDIRNFISLGALGIIEKPFDPMTLPQKINDLWRVRQ